MQYLLIEMGCTPYQGVVYEDNQGAIHLTKNYQVGARTKHIDIRHHWIRDLHQQQRIVIKYIRSENNIADIATKNVPAETYNRHGNNIAYGATRAIGTTRITPDEVRLEKEINDVIVEEKDQPDNAHDKDNNSNRTQRKFDNHDVSREDVRDRPTHRHDVSSRNSRSTRVDPHNRRRRSQND